MAGVNSILIMGLVLTENLDVVIYQPLPQNLVL